MSPNPLSTPVPPALGRRTFLRGTALGVGALAVAVTAGCAPQRGQGHGAMHGPGEGSGGRTPAPVGDFTAPLRVPPLAESTTRGRQRVFDLTLQAGRSQIVPQGETETWGVNGPLLGPTLRVQRGEEIRINVQNTLDESSTLHWHGMRLPAAADGGPHQMIEPGETWSPSWTVDQQAATLWYHPHPHGQTERHVHRGLGGFFLIDDEDSAALGLPSEYGVDDVPLIVQDRTFDDSGAFVETRRRMVGMLGETILVNGTAAPRFDATATLTRFRILNGSAARSYHLGLADGRAFHMIASDGGLLSAPLELDRIMLTPGERAEIVVRLEPGEEVLLRSFPQDLGVHGRMSERAGAADEFDIMLLAAAPTLRSRGAVPAALAAVTAIDPASATATRRFELGNNRINGLRMDMDRIDATVAPETVEVWEVHNTHMQPHNFHIHDVQFLVLDLDGAAPPPELAGWKDTIYTPPGVKIRLAMRFGANADPEVPYMFHCHLLWHEDLGMMGQFLVAHDG